MKRSYTQTELWMSYGVVAGGAIGSLLFILTGSPLWLALVALGVIVGLQVGQYRDRAKGDTSLTGATDQPSQK